MSSGPGRKLEACSSLSLRRVQTRTRSKGLGCVRGNLQGVGQGPGIAAEVSCLTPPGPDKTRERAGSGTI